MLASLLSIAALLLVAIADPEFVEHGGHGHEGHYAEDGSHNADYDHEAVLGSEDSAKEFSQLPPEVAKRRLGALVDRIDTNGDGVVVRDELVEWIKGSFSKLNEEEAKKKIAEEDSDGDRLISWLEYIKSSLGYSEADLEAFNKESDKETALLMEKTLSMDKKKFAAADLNADKVLSVKEYAAFLHPYDYDHMAAFEVERVLNDMDKNKDGFIDEKEYLGDTSESDPELVISEKENFKFNDRNKDGKLTPDEIKKWVSPDVGTIAEEESDHLISETDTNKDGKLTKEEIIAQHELWVGSEATDYGNHLHKDEL